MSRRSIVRIGARPAARHGGHRFVEQPFEAIDSGKLASLFRFGLADEGQLVERQLAQSLELLADPPAARLQLGQVDRLTEHEPRS